MAPGWPKARAGVLRCPPELPGGMFSGSRMDFLFRTCQGTAGARENSYWPEGPGVSSLRFSRAGNPDNLLGVLTRAGVEQGMVVVHGNRGEMKLFNIPGGTSPAYPSTSESSLQMQTCRHILLETGPTMREKSNRLTSSGEVKSSKSSNIFSTNSSVNKIWEEGTRQTFIF